MVLDLFKIYYNKIFLPTLSTYRNIIIIIIIDGIKLSINIKVYFLIFKKNKSLYLKQVNH